MTEYSAKMFLEKKGENLLLSMGKKGKKQRKHLHTHRPKSAGSSRKYTIHSSSHKRLYRRGEGDVVTQNLLVSVYVCVYRLYIHAHISIYSVYVGIDTFPSFSKEGGIRKER